MEERRDDPYFMKFCEARYRECSKSMGFIETLLATRFDNVDTALALAREMSEQSKDLARQDLNRHLELLNNSAKKIEKLEGTFATKDGVAREFKNINRIIYIGVGAFIVLEIVFKVLIK
jgi:hypothetical protein